MRSMQQIWKMKWHVITYFAGRCLLGPLNDLLKWRGCFILGCWIFLVVCMYFGIGGDGEFKVQQVALKLSFLCSIFKLKQNKYSKTNNTTSLKLIWSYYFSLVFPFHFAYNTPRPLCVPWWCIPKMIDIWIALQTIFCHRIYRSIYYDNSLSSSSLIHYFILRYDHYAECMY